MRMVVDLPDPFGPRKPTTSPRSTANEMPSTARLAPKVFTRFSILIMGVCELRRRIIAEIRPGLECDFLRRFRPMKKIAALLCFLLGVLAQPATAQQYPAKPVKIVVPFAPGGGSDFIARFMAQRLTETLGAQVIVENKPGAGGVLGIEVGVKSAPDGYTLTLIASSYTVNPSIYKLN